MSVDVQFLTLCDHNVSGKQYREDMCPRCLGKGYYIDIVFDAGGKAVTTQGEIKLQQECIKVLLDEQLSDLFFPEWGSIIHTFIGKKKVPITKARLEMAIRRSIERLKEIQSQESLSNRNMTDEEIIKDIEWIDLEALSVTEWACTVTLSNRADDIYQYSITV